VSTLFAQFGEIWLLDFEFGNHPGELPVPRCMVAREHRSGRVLKFWADELREMSSSPFDDCGRTPLLVAYYASAEVGCFLALGWPVPPAILDLYVEFRNLTNGKCSKQRSSLLDALAAFGLPSISTEAKDHMRRLALRGEPYSASERNALLQYCANDVDALAQLLDVMADKIDLPRALIRGRYMRDVAHIERNGIPIDQRRCDRLKLAWPNIKKELIREVDESFNVYEQETFCEKKFEEYLRANAMSWPRLRDGRLELNDDTFREMRRVYPQITSLHELRVSLAQLGVNKISIGPDGRNRYLLSPFRASTSRNQPSSTASIFGPAVWIRGLIRPDPGYGLAYIDWSQQEFGIAAALSGDAAMLAAYKSGDPYLKFAKQAGAVPADATKKSHHSIREQFKACALAVQYGMGGQSLGERIGHSAARAQELLALHRSTYPVFWKWSDAAVDKAMLESRLTSTFGWQVHIGPTANPRALRNFPMQANGAEMMRLAVRFALDRGVTLNAVVHDALLIEAPFERLDQAIATTQSAMAMASREVLGGISLRSDVQSIPYPHRFRDRRGTNMWNTVWSIVAKLERSR
jgi:hypothetical protein